MESKSFGGNLVKTCNLNSLGEEKQIIFAECSYSYYFLSLHLDDSFDENNLQSYTLLAIQGQVKITALGEGLEFTLKKGDSLQIENQAVFIKALSSDVKLLVSGSVDCFSEYKSAVLSVASAHKKVVKPWGHELWFNGEHRGYSLKEVMIKKGNRTSLQYHNFKEETNVLLEGEANFIYKSTSFVKNDDVSDDDLGSVTLYPTSIIHVTPKVLHRIEALTDVLLYETSTPFLDDVIRVQDDKSRMHGRIVAEHVE